MTSPSASASADSLHRLAELCHDPASPPEKVSVALHNALAEHGSAPSWSSILTPTDQESILRFAVALPSHPPAPPELVAWLTSLKVIARGRVGLEALYEVTFIGWLIRQVDEAEVASSLEAARLLLNLTILNKERLHVTRHCPTALYAPPSKRLH
jgi:hypothetical protein